MYLKNSSDSFTNLEFSESTNLLTNIYDDFFFNFQTEKKKTVLDQFDFCFLFQLLKLWKNSWKHRMNLLGDKKFFWYIPVIPWGQGGWHVCWRLLFLLYNVFITDRTEAVCTIVWIETAPIAAQYRMLFHVVWFLIHFVLWFFLSCFFLFPSQSDDFFCWFHVTFCK